MFQVKEKYRDFFRFPEKELTVRKPMNYENSQCLPTMFRFCLPGAFINNNVDEAMLLKFAKVFIIRTRGIYSAK